MAWLHFEGSFDLKRGLSSHSPMLHEAQAVRNRLQKDLSQLRAAMRSLRMESKIRDQEHS